MRVQHHLARVAMAAALICGGALCAPRPAFAATFTVNSSGDAGDANPGDGKCATASGACTLRAAIEEANALAGADTITIPAMTITLGKELHVSGDVTLNGAGESQTILDGNHVTRVFHFVWTTHNHSLNNLTVRNAKTTLNSETEGTQQEIAARKGNGGAILNESHLLKLTHVTLSGNQAVVGGGLYNVYLGNWQFTHRVELSYVTVSGNVATSTAQGGGGGGIFNGSELVGTNVSIVGNQARQGGGLLNNSFESVTLSSFQISGNSAIWGGGIDNDLGSLLRLQNGVLDGNTATTSGGGLYNNKADEYGATNRAELTNVQVTNNSVTDLKETGGGLINLKFMTLNNVLVSGNSATYGAGIYNGNWSGVYCAMSITNTTITGNIGVGAQDARGGGIYNVNNADLTLTNVTLTGNSAAVSGGIENWNQQTPSTITLRNSILWGNSASIFHPNCTAALRSGGYNLVATDSACTLSGGTGDQFNIDPRLLALADNGGGTLTYALQAGSPAIDKGGNAACPAIDQRGSLRPVDGDGNGQAVCDVGAYETTHQILTSLSPSRATTGGLAFTLTVNGSGFEQDCLGQLNGQSHTTSYRSDARLDVSVFEGDVRQSGRVRVTVTDPDEAGAWSNVLWLIVGPPVHPVAFMPFIAQRD